MPRYDWQEQAKARLSAVSVKRLTGAGEFEPMSFGKLRPQTMLGRQQPGISVEEAKRYLWKWVVPAIELGYSETEEGWRRVFGNYAPYAVYDKAIDGVTHAIVDAWATRLAPLMHDGMDLKAKMTAEQNSAPSEAEMLDIAEAYIRTHYTNP